MRHLTRLSWRCYTQRVNWLAQISIGDEFLLRPGRSVSDIGSLGNLISTILPNVYVVAGVILLFLLIGGGLTIIINSGKNNPENVAKGQKAVTAAIIGFLIIFASYWLIQIVEHITGLDIFGTS